MKHQLRQKRRKRSDFRKRPPGRYGQGRFYGYDIPDTQAPTLVENIVSAIIAAAQQTFHRAQTRGKD